jgi:hypothetical protein
MSVDTRCKPIYQTNPGSYLSEFAHLLGIPDEEVRVHGSQVGEDYGENDIYVF